MLEAWLAALSVNYIGLFNFVLLIFRSPGYATFTSTYMDAP